MGAKDVTNDAMEAQAGQAGLTGQLGQAGLTGQVGQVGQAGQEGQTGLTGQADEAAQSSQTGELAAISTTSAGAIIAAMHGDGGSALDVPKPFSQPICLVPTTRVAGTTHVEGIQELAEGLAEGDRLRLERDVGNRYDRWAIKVFDVRGNRLGFVSADVNEIPARLMDGGKRLFAQVTGIELVGSWWKIGMGVWLDD